MRTRTARTTPRVAALGASSIVALLALTGCGAAGTGTAAPQASDAGPQITADPELTALLPQSIRDAGVIKVATDPTYPPMEYFDTDGTTMIGLDIDLGKALAAKMGVDIEFTNLSFPNILAALEADRFDMTITAISDIPERRDVVSFVDYFSSGSNLLVQSANPADISDFLSVCGKKIGIQDGTTQLIDANKRQADCTAAGLPAMDISTYDTNDQANLALSSGRVDVVYAQTLVNAYVKSVSGDKYMTLPDDYDPNPIGIAIPKDDTELVTAIQAGVQALMDDGEYAEILEKWDLSSGALDSATVNGS